MWLAKRTQRAECPHTVKHYSTYSGAKNELVPIVKCLKCFKRLPVEKHFCSYCQRVTATMQNDCINCGLSKPTPDNLNK